MSQSPKPPASGEPFVPRHWFVDDVHHGGLCARPDEQPGFFCGSLRGDSTIHLCSHENPHTGHWCELPVGHDGAHEARAVWDD